MSLAQSDETLQRHEALFPTFTETLRTSVAALQAAYPERLGEIGLAHQAILEGYVLPVDLATGAGRVLSSQASTWYTVTGTGTCTCLAGQHGQRCTHAIWWQLYRYVAAEHADRTPPPVRGDWLPALPAPREAGLAPALPEAALSLTMRGLLGGLDAQLTVRGQTPEAFYSNLAAMGARLQHAVQGLFDPRQAGQAAAETATSRARPAPPDAPEGPGGEPQETGWCPVHRTAMEFHKAKPGTGKDWWSHKEFGWPRFCKGYPDFATKGKEACEAC